MKRRGALALAGSALTVGAAGAIGAVAGLAAERVTVSRARGNDSDPYADEPFGRLAASASTTVRSGSGTPLYAEIVEPARGASPALTVVAVHGFCLDMGTWHFQRRALTERGDLPVRLVVYDQPGHGRSGASPDGRYRISALGRDLLTVVDELTEGPVMVLGHSMGGMAIMAAAQQRPEAFGDRIVAVGLFNTSAGGLSDLPLGLPAPLVRLRKPLAPALTGALRVSKKAAESARRAGSDAVYLLTRRYGFGAADVPPSLVSYVEYMNDSTSMEVIAGYLNTLGGHDRFQALAALQDVPVLVIGGEADHLIPVQHSRDLAAALPGADYVELPGAGHLAPMEQHEAVDAELLHFCRQVIEGLPGKRWAEPGKGRGSRSRRART